MWLALAFALVGHLAWAAAEPSPDLFEDEPHYNRYAYEDALAGDTSLLPGSLRFDQRPELISRVWAQVVTAADMDGFAPKEDRFDPRLLDRTYWINLACLLGAIVALYAQGQVLGLSPAGRGTAALLLAAFPWFGFYVHTLWAEMLHALLAGLAFLGLVHHLVRGTSWVLFAAGLAAGVAVLAKGVLNLFLPVTCAVLALAGLRRARASGRRGGLLAALVPPLMFAGGVALVVLPQLLANSQAGHGWRLAGNRWKNLEMGIRLEPRELQEHDGRRLRTGLHKTYMDSGADFDEREAVSRARLAEYVGEQGLGNVLEQQLSKLALLVGSTPSFFERALDERWGKPPPAWLEALRIPGRIIWYTLLAGCAGGMLALGWRSPAWAFLALFVLYFSAALLTIPYKVRFVMPLVPTMALFTGGLLDVLRGRRRHVAPTLAVCAAIGLTLTGCRDSQTAELRPPNIVLVLSDDHAVVTLGCYGSKFARTPNIDRLAARGLLFQKAFCATALCAPSRASILTGTHAHIHGVNDNGGESALGRPTFPEALQAAGYRTALFGKWHLAGEPKGFDDWEVLIGQGSYFGPRTLRPQGERVLPGHVTEAMTELALTWLEDQLAAEGRFFLMLAHKAPHRPWQAAPDDMSAYHGDDLPLPATLFEEHLIRSNEPPPDATIAASLTARDLQLLPPQRLEGEDLVAWNAAYAGPNAEFRDAPPQGDELTEWRYRRFLESYLRCVAGLDRSVGAILDWVDRNELARDTAVIYASDHGAFLGNHGWFSKGWMYEEAMRLPLIVSWPGVIEPGGRDGHLVQTIDFAPTLCELAGAEALEFAQGRSLLPLLRGEDLTDWRDAIYYRLSEPPSSEAVPPHYGLRTARHKLIRIPSLGSWELYDLQRDPRELVNVADHPDFAETRGELEDMLERLRCDYRDSGE